MAIFQMFPGGSCEMRNGLLLMLFGNGMGSHWRSCYREFHFPVSESPNNVHHSTATTRKSLCKKRVGYLTELADCQTVQIAGQEFTATEICCRTTTCHTLVFTTWEGNVNRV